MGLHSKLQQWIQKLQISLATMDYVRGLTGLIDHALLSRAVQQ